VLGDPRGPAHSSDPSRFDTCSSGEETPPPSATRTQTASPRGHAGHEHAPMDRPDFSLDCGPRRDGKLAWRSRVQSNGSGPLLTRASERS
jgi:hypothetical protein